MSDTNVKSFIEDDRIWGVILIILGIASILFHPFEAFDRAMKGQTDAVLTAMLLILAGLIMWLAIAGRPAMKALAVVWIVTP